VDHGAAPPVGRRGPLRSHRTGGRLGGGCAVGDSGVVVAHRVLFREFGSEGARGTSRLLLHRVRCRTGAGPGTAVVHRGVDRAVETTVTRRQEARKNPTRPLSKCYLATSRD